MNRYNSTSEINYDGIKVKGSTVYTVPPESTEDYYLISTIGDRFDTLANEYYRDASLWYIIASANPSIRRDTLYIEPGHQIRIPLPLSKVLTVLSNENLSR